MNIESNRGKDASPPRLAIDPDARLNCPTIMSRRDFLRITASGAMATALLVGCGDRPSGGTREQGGMQSVIPEISPKLVSALGGSGVISLENAVSRYVNRYGSPIPSIRFDVADLSGQRKFNSDGSRVVILEQAGPGYVNYDVDALTGGKTSGEAQIAVRDTTIHSLTHACQGKASPLSTPIVLSDDSQVNALQGMSLLVTRPDGTETGFRAIEEGVCEALAVKLVPGYLSYDFSYFQLGLLTISIMNTLSSPHEIALMTQKNDVWGFVRIVTGKIHPTQQDLEQVMFWYQRARNGENLQVIQNEIVQSR